MSLPSYRFFPSSSHPSLHPPLLYLFSQSPSFYFSTCTNHFDGFCRTFSSNLFLRKLLTPLRTSLCISTDIPTLLYSLIHIRLHLALLKTAYPKYLNSLNSSPSVSLYIPLNTSLHHLTFSDYLYLYQYF